MRTLLAPTRGGEASYPNQDLAIRLAQELNAKLVFLYVSDVRFLGGLSVSYIQDLEQNLADMGEFLLTMALERAEKAGYSAETVVRRGNFDQAVGEVITEISATHVLLGTPTGTGHTDWKYLNDLTKRLVHDLGVEVYLADAGEILSVHKPSPE